MYNSRQENYLNVFFGEDSLKNKSFTIQQGDYNSNEVVCNLYTENESGKNDQMNLDGMTVTVVFKRDAGKPTPEYTAYIDPDYVGRVKFCIPQRIVAKAGDVMLQLKVYGQNSLHNSVVIPFEVRKSIEDFGHGDGCKPVTLHVIQKVEEALEELTFMRDELDEAEIMRQEKFKEWEEKMDEVTAEFEQEIINKPTRYDFPSVGDVNKIYKAQNEGKLYQWNDVDLRYDPLAFEEFEGSVDNITIIHGGNAYGTD